MIENSCLVKVVVGDVALLLAEVVNVDVALLNADGLLIVVVVVVHLVVGFPLVDLVVKDLFVVIDVLNVLLFCFSLSLFYSLLLFSSMLIMIPSCQCCPLS